MLGQKPQRRKIARSRIIILQKVHIDIQFLEQHLRYGLVPARREPLGAMVPAAQVDADDHIRGTLGDGGVDERGVLLCYLLGGLGVAVRGGLAHGGVAEEGEVCVVELEEAAACIVEGLDFVLVGCG